jgi:flagellar biosynthetic protein FliQ
MTVSQIMQVVQAALLLALKVSAPILLVAMAVGLLISVIQAATQIHEQTITFVPKLFAIAVVMIVLGPWMLSSINDFTKYIFSLIKTLN